MMQEGTDQKNVIREIIPPEIVLRKIELPENAMQETVLMDMAGVRRKR